MEYNADYWNSKWPIAPIIYSGRALRGKRENIGIDVRAFILTNDAILQEIIKKYGLKKTTYNETAWEIQKFIVRFAKYKTDDKTNQCPEFWQFPFESIQSGIGDCVANYEEIYTKEGIKKVGDLVVGDLVLSYDLEKKEYCYKPITKIWEKGLLPLKRTHLRNGQWIDITDNHPLWVRNSQKESIYEKTYLKDIDLTKWWKRKSPIAKKIPYEVKDIEWLTEELCFIIGHYIAEGWCESSKISTSGYDIIDKIISILEKYNIPFTEYNNNSGVPCLRFLKSDFKEYLKLFKSNSFDIHIPEEIFHLPEEKLLFFMNGFLLGDDHCGNYPNPYGKYSSNKQECYSTSSEQWARDIQRIGLQLGTPYHIWKQEHHGGCGTKPIYRITYNSNSHFLKDFGYEGISEVSISFIEDLEEVEMRDFEVADTHTFIFKNGLISHQCEDFGITMASLMINAGIPAYRVKVAAGFVQAAPGALQGGHAYCIYLADRPDSERGQEWVVNDWCYLEDSKIPQELKPLAKDGGYNGCYKEVWFTFNNEFSWNQTALEISGRISEQVSDKLITRINLDNIMESIDKKLGLIDFSEGEIII